MNQIPEKGPFTVKSRYHSIKYALSGLKLFFTTQHNAWIHLCSSILAIALGFVLQISLTEWAMVVTAIGMVLVAESFNTAIEFLVDFISPGFQEQAGKVKDLAAAAVLIAALVAVVLGLLVFVPRIIPLISK